MMNNMITTVNDDRPPDACITSEECWQQCLGSAKPKRQLGLIAIAIS